MSGINIEVYRTTFANRVVYISNDPIQAYKDGYAAGLDAAREAVAKEAKHGPLYSVRNSGDAQRGWDAMSRHALAAIDALEEKP